VLVQSILADVVTGSTSLIAANVPKGGSVGFEEPPIWKKVHFFIEKVQFFSERSTVSPKGPLYKESLPR